MKKLNIFLIIVTLIPKYAFSMGYVSIPTIIKVVVKADNTIYVTPFFNRIPHRGKAMNPVAHPMGGGEGRANGGRHPCSPTGVPAKGGKTRNPRNTSNKRIIRRRKSKREKQLNI